MRLWKSRRPKASAIVARSLDRMVPRNTAGRNAAGCTGNRNTRNRSSGRNNIARVDRRNLVVDDRNNIGGSAPRTDYNRYNTLLHNYRWMCRLRPSHRSWRPRLAGNSDCPVVDIDYTAWYRCPRSFADNFVDFRSLGDDSFGDLCCGNGTIWDNRCWRSCWCFPPSWDADWGRVWAKN